MCCFCFRSWWTTCWQAVGRQTLITLRAESDWLMSSSVHSSQFIAHHRLLRTEKLLITHLLGFDESSLNVNLRSTTKITKFQQSSRRNRSRQKQCVVAWLRTSPALRYSVRVHLSIVDLLGWIRNVYKYIYNG